MLKKLILMLCLIVLISLAGCSEGNRTTWAYGDDDALGVRLGTEVANNIEAGVSLNYWPEKDNDEHDFGAYAVYYVTDAPVGTYVGAQTTLADDNYYDQVAPIAGIVFDEIFFIEYQYKNWDDKVSQEEDKIVFGVRLTW